MGGLLQVFGAGPALVRQGLAGGLPEHLEGETRLGIVREVS